MHNQFKTYTRYLIIGIGIFSLWSTTACSRLANRYGIGTILREQSPEAEAQKRRKEIAKFYKVLRPEADVADIEDINIKDSSGKALLHYAVDREDLNIINALLNLEGIDVNIQDGLLQTPLHYAAKLNNSDIVDTLLKRVDTNGNIQDRYRKLPLHYAVWLGNLAITRKLLPITFNVNTPDWGGNTPLHYAVYCLIRLESNAVVYEDRDSLITEEFMDAAELLLNDVSRQYGIQKANKSSVCGKASMFYPSSINKISCWREKIDESVSEKLAALDRFPKDDVNKEGHQKLAIEALALINALLRAGADAHICNRLLCIEVDESVQERKGMSPFDFINGFKAEEREQKREQKREKEERTKMSAKEREESEARKKERGEIKPVTLGDINKMLDDLSVIVDRLSV